MRLLYLTSAWVGGLLLGLLLELPFWAVFLSLLAVFVAALLTIALGRRSFRVFVAALLVVLFLLGMIRSDTSEYPLAFMAEDARQEVRLDGIVADQPERSGNSLRFVFQTSSIDEGDGWAELTADVLVTARPDPELVSLRREPHVRYGDRLMLAGSLAAPPVLDTFDYRDHLASQGIHLVMDFPKVELLADGRGNPILAGLYDFRDEMGRSLQRTLPEPQAAVAQTLLLGQRDNLTLEMREDFRGTGTSHLLAISGLHVGVVLVLTMAGSAFLLGRRGPYFLLVPLLALWGYALLSGASPSVVRAAIMGTVYLAAVAAGRPRNVFPALALAAGVMAGLEPAILKNLSFQLSFAAVSGIALLGLPLTGWFQEKLHLTYDQQGLLCSVARGALLSAVVSVAATIATLPLVAFHFQQLPTLGIPATVLALPALPPILMTSGLTVAADAIHPALGQVVGWAAYVPITYLTGVIQAFAAIPVSIIEIPRFRGILVWLYYVPITLAALTPWHTLNSARKKAQAFLSPISFTFSAANLRLLVPAAALLLLAAVIWAHALSASDGRLHVIFLDVDQGDGILIVTPAGQRVLVDGGPDPVAAVEALNAHLPFWDRRLDLVVSTHTDEDHLAGLVGVVQRHPVDAVVEGIPGTSSLYLTWRQALEEKSIDPVAIHRGAAIDLGDGLSLNVLNPPLDSGPPSVRDSNNNSVVLRLQYGAVGFLLTGDIEENAELELIREGLPISSDVLKVSHHGSNNASGPFFLRAVSPAVAVVQSGEDNRFGHPHREVIDRLQKLVGEDGLYVTAVDGTVELTTDGHRLWVKTER